MIQPDLLILHILHQSFEVERPISRYVVLRGVIISFQPIMHHVILDCYVAFTRCQNMD